MRIYCKLNTESLVHVKRRYLLTEKKIQIASGSHSAMTVFSLSFLHPSLHTLISSFCFITFFFCPDDSDLIISNDNNPNVEGWPVFRLNFLNYEQCYDLK